LESHGQPNTSAITCTDSFTDRHPDQHAKPDPYTAADFQPEQQSNCAPIIFTILDQQLRSEFDTVKCSERSSIVA
jgi:hypothetical protein